VRLLVLVRNRIHAPGLVVAYSEWSTAGVVALMAWMIRHDLEIGEHEVAISSPWAHEWSEGSQWVEA
tara:strand:+ start:154 stop:354 length:201 start_codon:yes stop_codon:yes gene_type:complete